MKALLIVFGALAIGCSNQNSDGGSSSDGVGLRNGQVLKMNGQYPAQRSVVLLRMINTSGFKSHLCGGVLIGKGTVLSAAHCFESMGKMGNVGVEILFSHNSRDSKISGVRAKKVEIHPGYNQGGYPFTYQFARLGTSVTVTHQRRFDFALLSFDGDLPTGFVPAVIDTDASRDLTGETVIAYGAGASGNAFEARSNADTLRLLPGLLARGSFVVQSKVYSGEDFYMVEGVAEERICGGDSGGPQFLLSALVPTVVGINSARMSEAAMADKEACGPASLAAKVSSAADWILATKQSFEAN